MQLKTETISGQNKTSEFMLLPRAVPVTAPTDPNNGFPENVKGYGV
jgi:hypothetical protein